MQITVTLPDDIVQHPDPGREALEALVIEEERPPTWRPSHSELYALTDRSGEDFRNAAKARFSSTVSRSG